MGLEFTKNGSKAAYLISEGGSDWRKCIVINPEKKKIVEDTLEVGLLHIEKGSIF